MRKRPLDAPLGGLGRQGAVRKRKDEIHEMNGHKFVQRQFYQLMLCAFCSEFLLNTVGYQCEDCRYTCHKKCYEKVVTKCISKSNTGVSPYLNFGTCRVLTILLCRRVTKRKSIIVYLTGSNPSRILALIGVVTAVTCYLLVAKTRGNAQSAI